MKNNALVSIITPSYNQAKYLEETILSVLNQKYTNIEYIVIDGGSSDGSVDIIKKYADRLAFWVSEPDKGQANAINKGIQKATGDYICWINSDDLLYPTFIDHSLKAFQQYPEVDFIYGDVHQGKDLNHLVLRKGEKTDFTRMLRTTDVPIPQQSTIWKRTVIDKVGLLEEKWHVLLDREYFMRIAMNCKIKYIPGAEAFFRNHDLSKSMAESMRWAEEMPIYYDVLFSQTLPVKYKRYRKEALTNMHFFCGLMARESKPTEEMKSKEMAKHTSKYFYYKHLYYKPFFRYYKALKDKIL